MIVTQMNILPDERMAWLIGPDILMYALPSKGWFALCPIMFYGTYDAAMYAKAEQGEL